ncbi:MAG: hypothetical protein J2P38_10680 [Candidatus Dormibacteraeota bacterium]|nr:hypothetical protein [Candidatus Dormibacteraeota bacterium]
MATLTFELFAEPAVEMRRIAAEPRPDWVDRILQSRAAGPERFPLSCALEALGERLGRRLDVAALLARKSEARGWAVELAGDQVRITTAASAEATRAALEADGVWHLAQRLARGTGEEAVLR